jgi:hypothetical protein
MIAQSKRSPPWLDSRTLVAEFLARTGLIDRILFHLGRAALGVPRALARWLGPDLRTPTNSARPRVQFAEDQPVSGILVVHQDEAVAWILIRLGDSAGRKDPELPFLSHSTSIADTSRQADPRWREDELFERPPWEASEWRRSR